MQKLNKKSIKKYARLSDFIYKQSGITIVALVIIIIVMMILTGVTVTVAISGNLFGKTKESVDKYDKAKDIEQIGVAYLLKFQSERESSNIENKTNEELFEDVKKSLDFEDATYNIVSEFMNIVKKDGTQYTLLADGTIIEEKLAYLDIADGSIELKENGYIQGQNELVEYKGKYIITGTTTENTIKITGTGNYNIVIKNLNIDVIEKGLCSFDANNGYKKKETIVNLTIEGNNKLYSGAGAGLMFKAQRAAVDNLVEALKSKLIIDGNGSLDAQCQAGYDGSGIGGLYDANSPVTYIEIKSGIINANGFNHGWGIGRRIKTTCRKYNN